MRKINATVSVFIAFVIVFNFPIVNATKTPVSEPNIKIITPEFIKNTTIDYIKIDTPAGQINVPQNTFNKEGNKVIKKYMDFIDLKKEFEKLDQQKNLLMHKQSVANISNLFTTSSITSPLTPLTSIEGLWDERSWYYVSGGQSPTLLAGTINPLSYSNPNNAESFLCYSEREIYLGAPYYDALEVITAQSNEASWQNKFIIVVYDNGDSNESIPLLSVNNGAHAFDYCVYTDSSDHTYNVEFADRETGQTFFNYYSDSNNYCDAIIKYAGSTELYDYSAQVHNFFVDNSIVDYYTKVNGYITYPGMVFGTIVNELNRPYVYTMGTTDGYGTYTTHKAGYPDPS